MQLELRLWSESPELLAQPVRDFLQGWPQSGNVQVAPIDPELADTAAFCERYEVGLEVSANCVIIAGKRGDEVRLAACVVLATTRADVNGVVRKLMDARKASFAPMDDAVRLSGHEFGGITPIGLPGEWPIFVDSAVSATDHVIVGSGIRASKIWLPGKSLSDLPSAEVVDGLAR